MQKNDDRWNVLLIDDDEEDFMLIRNMLGQARQKKFHLEWARSYAVGMEMLFAASYDIVLVDYDLGASSGVNLIRAAAAGGVHAPFLLVTGQGNFDVDLEAMQAGALDYLVKSTLNPDILERSIRYAIDRKRIESELAAANQKLLEANHELNQERIRLRTLIDYAPSGILLTNGQGKILFVNPAAEKLLNGQVLGNGFLPEGSFTLHRLDGSAFPAEELPLTRAILQGAITDHVTLVARHQTGKEVVILKNSAPIRDEDGRITGAVAVMQDITESYWAEQNIRLMADLGEKLLTLEDPIAMLDCAVGAIAQRLNVDRCIVDEVNCENRTITILSESYRQPPCFAETYPLQWRHEEIEKGIAEGDAVVVNDAAVDPLLRNVYEDVFKAIGVRSLVCIPLRKEGRWMGTLSVVDSRPHNWRADEIALLKQAGDLVWLAVEKARLLDRLKTAQDRFEVALKNTEITVYTTDLERRYTWVHSDRLGLRDTEILGRRDEEIFPIEAVAEIIDLKQTVLNSGQGIRRDVSLVMGDQVYDLDMTIEPLRDADDEMVGLIVAAQDTTRRRQMEAQVRETANHLAIQRKIFKHREEERQQIARNLHDGPIQDLISLLFTIQAAMAITHESEVIEALSSVREEAQKLIGELRGVCNELRPPTLVQFGLAKAIRSHIEEFHEKHNHLRFTLDLVEDGRSLPDDVRLVLYRVYQESLNNIVRHAHATRVSIYLGIEGETVKMVIQDNGVGFEAPEDWINLARQGHLGLVGMKERVEAVQGKLTLSSFPGRGTSIAITIPFTRVPDPISALERWQPGMNPA